MAQSPRTGRERYAASSDQQPEAFMNEDTFNMSIRKFLKMVGVKSQHEIEQAVQRALKDKTLADHASVPVVMTLNSDSLNLKVEFDGKIELG
jgi:hypothetical protein